MLHIVHLLQRRTGRPLPFTALLVLASATALVAGLARLLAA